MASNKKITKEADLNLNSEGYFYVDLGDGMMYEGKIIGGQRNGFGRIFIHDKLIYQGMWIDNETVDDIPLPGDRPQKINMDKCQKIRFNYDSKIEKFDLTYYIPFHSDYKLSKLIDKAIKQTDLSEHNEITVTVDNTECDLTECIDKADQIDELAYYITKLDFECSECRKLNRGWQCCGQFAPFMYVYYILLFEGYYETYKDKFQQNDMGKGSQIYNISNVFYKIFTGYSYDTFEYEQTKANIADLYNIKIPNVDEDYNYWLVTYPNDEKFQIKPNLLNYEKNKCYLILICNEDFISHYSFIYRCNDYIIMCDSWSHEFDNRMPITRIIRYDEFIKCVIKINNFYEDNIGRELADGDEGLLLYNFIIDALFLIPYGKKYIDKGSQSILPSEISYIATVNPDKFHNILNILDDVNEPFNMYFEMGGKRKKKTNKKKTMRRKGKGTKEKKGKGTKKVKGERKRKI